MKSKTAFAALAATLALCLRRANLMEMKITNSNLLVKRILLAERRLPSVQPTPIGVRMPSHIRAAQKAAKESSASASALPQALPQATPTPPPQSDWRRAAERAEAERAEAAAELAGSQLAEFELQERQARIARQQQQARARLCYEEPINCPPDYTYYYYWRSYSYRRRSWW